MYEVEVKGQLQTSTEAAMKRLKENGFTFKEAQFQDDIIFARRLTDITEPRPGVSIARVRTEDGRSIVTVKTYTETALSKIEHETTVGSREDAAAILRSLGLKEIVRIQKWRKLGNRNNVTVCLDDVIDLGAFVEFELLYREQPTMTAQEELYEMAKHLLAEQFTRVLAGYDELALARKKLARTRPALFDPTQASDPPERP
jgi:adenylate cyclase class 2